MKIGSRKGSDSVRDMNGLRRVRHCALLIAAVFIFGCSRSTTSPSSSQKRPTAALSESALIIRASDSPTDGDSREPELNATQDGRIILSWVEKIGDKRYALRTSTRDGKGWSEARTVAAGENWFVNWADFPSVVAMPDGSLAAHWLVNSGSGTYAYNVNIARSEDGGKTWSTPVVPHRDNTQTEHGFVSLIPLPDGRLGAVWLDGRNMKDMKHDGDEHAPASQSMTLRYAAIDRDGKLSDEAQLDERVCECCQTSAAVTSEGAIAVYRDRSQSEVRDIYSVKQANGSWSAPQAVHADKWEINGCPVNGPAVAADSRRVAVAWFTGANDTPHVKLAFSNDAAATFGSPIQIDDGDSAGRVDVLLLPDGSALVCWMSGNAEGGAIKVRRAQPDGTLGPTAVVAQTDISRSSGFPRMARLGDEVHFAWTEFGKPSRVRTATANISAYK
jgi:BNR repeat-like domain